MASIVTNLTCELTTPVSVVFLPGNMFSMDNGGNIINVFVVQNGAPATLGGSVSANVIRSDGTTVAITGALEGNKAYIILPQACYAVPGIIHIVMKITEGTTITTIAAITANVYQSSTDAIVDPGTLVPSVAALIAQIEAAVDSIPVDYSGLLLTLAKDYTQKPYIVGEYAWQGGVLKRCIVPITTAETYTAAHWTNAVLGDDVTALKSAFEQITTNNDNLLNPNTISANSYVDSQGNVVSNDGTWTSDVIEVPNGKSHVVVSYLNSQNVKTLVTSSTLRVIFYGTNGYINRSTSGSADLESGTTNIRIYISNSFAANRIMVEFASTMSSDFVPYAYYINPNAVIVDTTLTSHGLPADSKATGDAIDIIKEKTNAIYNIANVNNANLFNPYTVTMNKSLISQSGEEQDSTGSCVSDYIKLPEGIQSATALYMASNGTITIPNKSGRIDCYYYTSDKTFISPQYGQHNVPTNGAYVRLSIASTYASARWTIMYGSGNLNTFTPYDKTLLTNGSVYKNDFNLVEYLSTHTGTVVKLVGDSITQGVGGTGFAQDGEEIYTYSGTTWAVNTSGYCWGNLFKTKIESLFDATVLNYGTRAVSSNDMWTYDLMIKNIIAETDDIIILMLGTNDRTETGYLNAVIGKERFKSNLQAIIEYVISLGKKIICLSPIPATPTGDTETGVLFGSETVNVIVSNVCSQTGVPYVDLFSAFTEWVVSHDADYSEYFSDTLHPNDKGYCLIYYLVCQALHIPNDLTFELL